MNRKAFRKSRETGVPWVVHPVGRRVLPWPGNPAMESLSEEAGRFELRLSARSERNPYGEGRPPESDPDDRTAMAASTAAAGGDTGQGVMERLVEIVSERRQTMPEGSYTTHLFSEGLEKIRKKTGEEAVELILAKEGDDVVFEAADLIYHLLVLLEASGRSWAEVQRELLRRHTGD
jgi:phosphoribosyl-ATP pyrophosphohydrolase